jgi:hypothetical protein
MVAKSHKRSYTYIPQLDRQVGLKLTNLIEQFSALDFDDEKLEYDLASAWAHTHDPSRINGTLRRSN